MPNSQYFHPDDTVIDPRLEMPDVVGVRPGLLEEELDYEEDAVLSDVDYESPLDLSEIGVDDLTPNVDQLEESKLPVPDSVEIISQRVRISPDGTHLVDIVIEVGGLPDEITQCDIRKTKK